jgi:hypothetical protein
MQAIEVLRYWREGCVQLHELPGERVHIGHAEGLQTSVEAVDVASGNGRPGAKTGKALR